MYYDMHYAGPLHHTVRDFWRMVDQERVNRIVMLANLTENGRVIYMYMYYMSLVNIEINV